MDRIEDYKQAVLQNDEAHQREIRQVAERDGVIRQDRFKEIQREARMWLRHLAFIHHVQ